ncbi:MAG: cation diffusion facilitator family transporter [Candidatus Dormibacteraceae bacterium]
MSGPVVERPHRHFRGAAGSLRVALVLTCLILLGELGAGLWSHSLALISDAGHELADVVSLVLALLAMGVQRRPADSRRTYGYHRAGILAALGNAGILTLIVAVILTEAARRFAQPQPVQGLVVVGTAAVAIIVNAYVALGLGHARADLNVRAALLHVLGDLAGALGVIVAGVVILLTGFLYADPIVSVLIALLIGGSALRIGLETVNVLLEGTPRGIDLGEVAGLIRATAGAVSVHDLHIWSIAPEQIALSCHVVVEGDSLAGAEKVVREMESRLCDSFAIGHTTIQLECGDGCPSGLAGTSHGRHNHPHPGAPARVSVEEGALLGQDAAGHRHR